MIKEKLKLLRSFCAMEGLNLLDYFAKYRGRFFLNTNLDKFELFRGLLTNRLNEKESLYVNHMLNIKHRDKRSALEYGSELVLGWLIEDVVGDLFGLDLSGSDSDREFLPSGKISNLTDFRYGDRPVELMVAWGTYWGDLGRTHFRHDKLGKLLDAKAIVLGFAIRCGKFFVMDAAPTNSINFGVSLTGLEIWYPGLNLISCKSTYRPTSFFSIRSKRQKIVSVETDKVTDPTLFAKQ
jgi:hypothetical protein